MYRKNILLILNFYIVLLGITYAQVDEIIKVENSHFVKGTKPYKFLGANYWYGMYLGMESELGDRDRLIRELDELKRMGITNLRILGSSEGKGKYQINPTLLSADGQYNEDIFEGLDFFMNELRKRDMTAVIVLNNFWMWSGGMPQYVSWAENSSIPLPEIENGGSWDEFINYSMKFYENAEAQKMFQKHLKKLVNRRNTFTKKKYKNDPTILSWQIANEPRGYSNPEGYRKWIKKTSNYLGKLDKNHMISIGAEGNTNNNLAGIDLYLDNNFEQIDYATIHIWIQNWNWYDPNKPKTFVEAMENTELYLLNQLEKAKQLEKPVVIEEFGVSRDQGEFEDTASIEYRNKFYEYIFDFTVKSINSNDLVQGCNFWSWAGEGRPVNPGGIWKDGEELIGDPPHERQGWYSVYDKDASTIKLIEKYAKLIK